MSPADGKTARDAPRARAAARREHGTAGPSRPRVLTVAGTDPTGGAGVAADLKTFAAHGAYGAAVVTALVAQDTLGVRSVHVPPAGVLRDQLDAVADDVVLDAVKIGMLGSVENARAVASWLDRARPPFVVLDPVLAASSGGALARDPSDAMLDALRAVAARCDVVTPNLGELAALSREPVAPTWDDALAQARRLATGLSARRAAAPDAGRRARPGGADGSCTSEVWVLVTGGHLGGDASPDALVGPGGPVAVLDGPRLDVTATHGTGCGLSSALAALRPVRSSWADAARDAKTWLAGALRDGGALDVGRGSGPVDHLHGIPAPGAG